MLNDAFQRQSEIQLNKVGGEAASVEVGKIFAQPEAVSPQRQLALVFTQELVEQRLDTLELVDQNQRVLVFMGEKPSGNLQQLLVAGLQGQRATELTQTAPDQNSG